MHQRYSQMRVLGQMLLSINAAQQLSVTTMIKKYILYVQYKTTKSNSESIKETKGVISSNNQ